jgi:hypothetical protein
VNPFALTGVAAPPAQSWDRGECLADCDWDHLNARGPAEGSANSINSCVNDLSTKTALDHFLIDENRKAEALKRGGAFDRIPLNISDLELSIPDDESLPSGEAFDREWIATLMAEAMKDLEAALRTEGREAYFRVFQRYYLQDANSQSAPSRNPHKEGERDQGSATQASVAAELGLEVYDVNNYLLYARRKLRLLLKERISTYSASEQDALREFGFVLGE